MGLLAAWFSAIILFFTIPLNNIDKDLNVYYAEFMALGKEQCNKIQKPNQFSIRFSKLTDDNIGLCTVYLHRKEILIDENYWTISNLETKKQLMFHELTHCILNKHHIDTEDNYMNPYLIQLPEDVLYNQVKENMTQFCNDA
jgi:Zn-dependent peptidase ImmA (M78 family)